MFKYISRFLLHIIDKLSCIRYYLDTLVPTQIIYTILLIALVGILVGWYKHSRTIACFSFLLSYIFLMLCSTVIYRNKLDGYEIELMPFWNYPRVFSLFEPMEFWEVILNIILFIPVGFGFSAILYPHQTWKKVLICVTLLSLAIEVAQLVTQRGLCETNDLIHNTIGGMMGYYVYTKLCSICKSKNTKIDDKE